MKLNPYRILSNSRIILFIAVFLFCLMGCKENDPQKEDVPELITKATLTFKPSDGGAAIVATATDPDGEGVKNITIDGSINLSPNKTYILSIALVNALAETTDPAYNITAQVEAEGIEHMFFFSWTNNVFADPTGNGNIDNRNDPLNYKGAANSLDSNGRPLGLTTTWKTATTTGAVLTGTFRVLLKHQPDLKSDTSDSTMGETDLDLAFSINIQ